MPLEYLVIGIDKFVNANNRLYVDFIDVNNFLKRFLNMNEIEHKSVIDVDKLVHANRVSSDWCRQVFDANNRLDVNFIDIDNFLKKIC